MREFDDFMEIVRKIRRNCPWDSVQTHESLKKYLLEESNEVLEGIDRLSKENDSTNLCEELGDVLFQAGLSWEELKQLEKATEEEPEKAEKP